MADIKCSDTAARLSLTLLSRGQHEVQFLARLLEPAVQELDCVWGIQRHRFGGARPGCGRLL